MARLRAEMPQAEYMRWSIYFARIAQREQLADLKAKAGRRG